MIAHWPKMIKKEQRSNLISAFQDMMPTFCDAIGIKPPKNIPRIPFTDFKLAMTHEPQCMHEGQTVRSYREYYQTKQDRFKMVWTKRPVPEWFNVAA